MGPYIGPNDPRGGIFELGNMCFHKPGSDRDLWVPLKFCHQGGAWGPLLPTRLLWLASQPQPPLVDRIAQPRTIPNLLNDTNFNSSPHGNVIPIHGYESINQHLIDGNHFPFRKTKKLQDGYGDIFQACIRHEFLACVVDVLKYILTIVIHNLNAISLVCAIAKVR